MSTITRSLAKIQQYHDIIMTMISTPP